MFRLGEEWMGGTGSAARGVVSDEVSETYRTEVQTGVGEIWTEIGGSGTAVTDCILRSGWDKIGVQTGVECVGPCG